jgi:formate dehydrogenase assembly factor FdhD
VVISRSAATDRAVELAGKLNMIMIGFARQNRIAETDDIVAGQPGVGSS